MRRTRFMGAAAAVATVAALAGSAFTASNTMPADPGTAGYGEVVASGVTVSNIEYVVSTTDGSLLDRIDVSTTDADAGDMTGTLSIKNLAGTLIVESQDCGLGVEVDPVGNPGTYVFTCDPTTDPAVVDVVTVGFTATRPAV